MAMSLLAQNISFLDCYKKGQPSAKARIAARRAELGVAKAPENCPACAMGLTAEFVFKRLDVNGDGRIVVEEFQKSPGMQLYAQATEAVGRIDTSGDGDALQPGSGRSGAVGPPNMAMFLSRFDQNGDGKLTEGEMPSGLWQRRRDRDANADGTLTSEELGTNR